VLVWITKLGGSGVNNVTQISNLQFVRSPTNNANI